jgi:hypothetical protein
VTWLCYVLGSAIWRLQLFDLYNKNSVAKFCENAIFHRAHKGAAILLSLSQQRKKPASVNIELLIVTQHWQLLSFPSNFPLQPQQNTFLLSRLAFLIGR